MIALFQSKYSWPW